MTDQALPGLRALERGPTLWSAWASVTWREAAWFALLGLLVAGMNMTAIGAGGKYAGAPVPVFVAEMLTPVLHAMLLLLTWLPADRSAADSPHRVLRLALAVFAAAALAASLTPALLHAVGLPLGVQSLWDSLGKPKPPRMLRFVSELLFSVFTSGLAVAVIEMRGRHKRLQGAVQRALNEHTALAHDALASRLAAMQAQVEPQFLFDSLVDIERRYGESDSAAAAQLERLISHLRVALPRLRESGSTLAAEAELLQSYLAVLDGAMPGHVAGHVEYRGDIPVELRELTFHPMLLLPLVQRAVRHGGPPAFVGLAARRDADRLCITLSIAAVGLCTDDEELLRVRERLAALYDGRAQLSCDAGATRTLFTLILPCTALR